MADIQKVKVTNTVSVETDDFLWKVLQVVGFFILLEALTEIAVPLLVIAESVQ